MTVRTDLLSPRQKDCLRLAYKGLTTKEIARELGIMPGTVATYCAEAKTVLAARNRRHAALLLHDHEAAAPGAADSPSQTGPHSSGVDPDPAEPQPSPAIRRRASIAGPLAIGNREADNDLGITARLAWIVGLAILIAIGFGALAAGVRTVNDLVLTGHRTEQRTQQR